MEKGGVDVNPTSKSASDKRGFTTGISNYQVKTARTVGLDLNACKPPLRLITSSRPFKWVSVP
jgi:hypothetical protein